MKISRSGVLIALGFLLLASSVALEAQNISTDRKGRESAEQIVREFKEIVMENSDEDLFPSVSNDPDENDSGGFVIVNDERYCGIISIPAIEIELPVSYGYSYEQMSESLCRYCGSIEGRNMIICGHNYKSFLQNLDKVNEGDSVIFTDYRGISYEYAVSEIQLIGGYERRKLIEGGSDWDLSVFTCNYSGYYRYVLRCKFKE